MRQFWLGFGALFLLTHAGSVRAQSERTPGISIELSVGAVSSPGTLGLTAPVPQGGYFRLGAPPSAPSLGLGLTLPDRIGGWHPTARVGWSPARHLETRWIPCPPGSLCPSALLLPASRIGRVDALVGVERALPLPSHERFGAEVFAAVGVRRYEHRWEELGDPGTIFLSDGSTTETDPVVEVGLAALLHSGPWQLVTRVNVAASRYGPGSVPAEGDVPDSLVRLDFGRRTLVEYSVRMGVRRTLLR